MRVEELAKNIYLLPPYNKVKVMKFSIFQLFFSQSPAYYLNILEFFSRQNLILCEDVKPVFSTPQYMFLWTHERQTQQNQSADFLSHEIYIKHCKCMAWVEGEKGTTFGSGLFVV